MYFVIMLSSTYSISCKEGKGVSLYVTWAHKYRIDRDRGVRGSSTTQICVTSFINAPYQKEKQSFSVWPPVIVGLISLTRLDLKETKSWVGTFLINKVLSKTNENFPNTSHLILVLSTLLLFQKTTRMSTILGHLTVDYTFCSENNFFLR